MPFGGGADTTAAAAAAAGQQHGASCAVTPALPKQPVVAACRKWEQTEAADMLQELSKVRVLLAADSGRVVAA